MAEKNPNSPASSSATCCSSSASPPPWPRATPGAGRWLEQGPGRSDGRWQLRRPVQEVLQRRRALQLKLGVRRAWPVRPFAWRHHDLPPTRFPTKLRSSDPCFWPATTGADSSAAMPRWSAALVLMVLVAGPVVAGPVPVVLARPHRPQRAGFFRRRAHHAVAHPGQPAAVGLVLGTAWRRWRAPRSWTRLRWMAGVYIWVYSRHAAAGADPVRVLRPARAGARAESARLRRRRVWPWAERGRLQRRSHPQPACWPCPSGQTEAAKALGLGRMHHVFRTWSFRRPSRSRCRRW